MRLGQQEFLSRTRQAPEDVTGWPTRACCCSAAPAVKVLVPSPVCGSEHVVDIYLCGHHFRQSADTLVLTGAATVTRSDEHQCHLPITQ
jgi:hypothetical protein